MLKFFVMFWCVVYINFVNGNSFKILSLPIADIAVKKILIEEVNDPLVDLNEVNNPRIVPLVSIDKKYDAGHLENGKVRKGLYGKLLLLLEDLPHNISIAFFEGYRPLWKQKEYFENKFKEILKQYGDNDLERAYSETCKFVSPFIDNVPVHCTGAAIDFMLFTIANNGAKILLDCGKFGVIWGANDQTQTFSLNLTEEQKQNRLMLLNAATKAGLVNYGYEWWHYSYGDRAWAYVEEKEKAIYGLINEEAIDMPKTKEDFLHPFITSDQKTM